MRKKSRIMIAAAVGMVAIVVATTAVRCSIAHTAQQEGDAAPAAAEQPAPQGAGEGGAREDGAEGADAILSDLRGAAWESPDGSGKTIAFREGSFVESDGASVSVTAFEVEGSGASGGQRWLDVSLLRDGDAAAEASTIVLDGDPGGMSVACDGFALSGRYVQGSAEEGPFEVSGLAEPYVSLVDGKTGELTAAIADWAAGHAPTAGAASFDGEVFVDVGGGRVSATFHLDDAASTIVTAVYRSGEFSVVG